MTAQRPPPCRGPLLCQTNPLPNPVCTGKPCLPNQSFSDPVLYGRPRPCRTKSESQASTSQLRQAYRRQGKRKALVRPNGARTSSARPRGVRAISGHPSDQAAPGQTQCAPKAARRANTRHNSAGRQASRQTQGARQTKRHQSNRRTPTEASSRRTNPPDQAAPDQAAPGIQTEIASLNGDRRFQLQRSGTISSGPLKKLRVSCVHERDGKQVPCVRSLCSYARESRAC